MNTGVIYMATINKKSYIGQTSNFETRKRKHLAATDNFYFHRAIRKSNKTVGWRILEKDIPIHLLDEKEKRWIAFYNTFENGYNLTKGGDGVRGYKHSEEIKIKLSEYSKGENNPNKRPGVKEKLSKNNAMKRKSVSSKVAQALKGKPKSKEHRLNISKGLRGRQNKPHIWAQKDKIISGYESGLTLRKLSEIYKCGHNTIRNILFKNGIKIRSR